MADITSNLVYRWKFDNDVTDSVGGADFTDPGGLVYQDGAVNQELVLPTAAMTATDVADITDSGSYTISFFFTLTSATASDTVHFIRKGLASTSASFPGWSFYFITGQANLRFIVRDGTERAFYQTAALTQDQRYHVCVVFSRTTDVITLYLDAVVSDNTSGDADPSLIGDCSNSELFTLDGTAANEIVIDDLRFYTRALSTEDIEALRDFVEPVEASISSNLDGYGLHWLFSALDSNYYKFNASSTDPVSSTQYTVGGIPLNIIESEIGYASAAYTDLANADEAIEFFAGGPLTAFRYGSQYKLATISDSVSSYDEQKEFFLKGLKMKSRRIGSRWYAVVE